MIYLDDILIFSWDESEHKQHVQQVLVALQHHVLYLKISKCLFNAIEVNFLEFKINTEGIYMNSERIWAVKEWLPLKNVHELQIFLNFINFFWRFIKNYSQIAAPLLNLLKTERNKKRLRLHCLLNRCLSIAEREKSEDLVQITQYTVHKLKKSYKKHIVHKSVKSYNKKMLYSSLSHFQKLHWKCLKLWTRSSQVLHCYTISMKINT